MHLVLTHPGNSPAGPGTPMSDTFSKVEVITGVAPPAAFLDRAEAGDDRRDYAAWHVVSYVCALPWAIAHSVCGKETVRANDAVVAPSEVCRSSEAGARAGAAARPQSHEGRDPRAGARSSGGEKADLLSRSPLPGDTR